MLRSGQRKQLRERGAGYLCDLELSLYMYDHKFHGTDNCKYSRLAAPESNTKAYVPVANVSPACPCVWQTKTVLESGVVEAIHILDCFDAYLKRKVPRRVTFENLPKIVHAQKLFKSCLKAYEKFKEVLVLYPALKQLGDDLEADCLKDLDAITQMLDLDAEKCFRTAGAVETIRRSLHACAKGETLHSSALNVWRYYADRAYNQEDRLRRVAKNLGSSHIGDHRIYQDAPLLLQTKIEEIKKATQIVHEAEVLLTETLATEPTLYMAVIFDTAGRYEEVARTFFAMYSKREDEEGDLLVYPAELQIFVDRFWGRPDSIATMPAEPDVCETAIALWEPESVLYDPVAAVEAAMLVHAK